MSIQRALAAIVFLTACLSLVFAQQNGTPPKTLAFPLAAPVILVNQAMRPPSWAFVERAMLNAAADGVQQWVNKNVTPGGAVNVPERAALPVST